MKINCLSCGQETKIIKCEVIADRGWADVYCKKCKVSHRYVTRPAFHGWLAAINLTNIMSFRNGLSTGPVLIQLPLFALP